MQDLIRKGELTEELALSNAHTFDFLGAAQKLLPRSVLHGAYKALVGPVWEAYKRDRPATRTELDCVIAIAFARLWQS